MTHQYFKEKTTNLRELLRNNKIFLNMVLHDLKNPTSQIKFAIDQITQLFQKHCHKKDLIEEKIFHYANKLIQNLKNII